MDLEYLLFLQKIRLAAPDIVVQFFELVSGLGFVLFIPILCYVYLCGKKEDATLAIWSVGFALLFNGLLKQIFCIYRPWIRDPRIVPPENALAGATGYSFPSGHSTNAAAYLGALAWQNRRRIVLASFLFVLILLVCFSRNFLGVHTPQDVVVGFTCGMLSIPLAWFVLKWEKNGKNRDFVILGVSILIVAVYLAYITFKSYPLDYDAEGKLLVDPQKMALDSWSNGGLFIGVVLGWLLEKRFVKFQAPASALIGLCRFIVGFGGVFGLKHCKGFFCTLFTDPWGCFVTRFITIIFLIFIFPAIFTAIENGFVKKKEAVDEQPQD